MKSDNDPAFVSAIERSYLAGVRGLKKDSSKSTAEIHTELLERAIYKADPTNGGLRFKRLSETAELESRLMRYLDNTAID